MLKKIILLIFCITLSCALLLACNQQNQSEEPEGITEIELNENEITIEDTGKATLKFSVLPDGTSSEDVIWYSNDTSVATVDDGLVKAKKAGSAVIFCVSENGVYAKCIVNVVHKTHVEGEWVTVQAPDCENGGIKKKLCTVCDDTLDSGVIEKLGHTVGEWSVIQEAECEVDGLRIKSCTVCEKTLENEIIERTGHTSSDWIIDSEPTCNDAGARYHACTVCEKTLDAEVIPATGDHASDKWIVDKEASCSEEGHRYKSCDLCKTKFVEQTLEKLAHTEGTPVIENEVAASCDRLGSYDTVVYCTVCNTELSRTAGTLPMIDHTFGEWVNAEADCINGGTDTRSCTVCGHSETRDGTPLGHIIVSHGGLAPTCINDGYEPYETCSRTGCTHSTKVVLPKNPLYHEYVVIFKSHNMPTMAPTENGDGIGNIVCSVCNTSRLEIFPKLTSNKYTEISNDGRAVTYSYATTGLENESITVTLTICLHAELEWRVTKPATCKDKGVEKHFCVDCDEARDEREIEISETHTPGEWTLTVAPTCSTDGEEKQYCTVCDTELDVRSVDKTNDHVTDGYEIENVVPSTCTAQGSIDEVYYCTLCGEEAERITKPVKLADHKYETIDAKEATCQEAGFVDEECTVCGDTKHTDLPQLPHVYEPIFDLFGAPTEDSGVEALLECKNGDCGTLAGEMVNIPALSDENYVKEELEGGAIKYTITIDSVEITFTLPLS